MPVVGIPVGMLLERLQTRLGRDELVEHLQHLGCDVEGFATLQRFRCGRCDNILEITATENPPVACDRCGTDFRADPSLLLELGQSDVIRMELLAVRPDMFDPGGLARVLRHYLDETDEPARYELAAPHPSSGWRVRVDPAMGQAGSHRPNIACALIRNISLDDDAIKVIMKLQENLHWALGRDRKHASIGVYDLDTVQGPEIVYRAVGPEELRFTPLGCDPQAADGTMTPRQVLEQHPKGKAYARLLAGFERYPLLCDATGQVLSMPPIINSEQTRVTQATTSFLVDVTGTGERIVNRTLNILVTSLAEIDPGVTIEQVTISYPHHERITPDLSAQKVALEAGQVARTIGVPLSVDDVQRYLRRMGHTVCVAPHSSGDEVAETLEVAVPAYRNDIMHPIDLVEDVAIAYGYHNIEASLVPTMTVGSEQPLEIAANVVRRVMTGMGYAEVLTLLLSCEEQQYDAFLLAHRADRVTIDNPIGVEQTIVRTSLIPGLVDTFSVNTDHEMPQQIFEVGNISVVDASAETGAREVRMAAAAVTGPKADYAAIRSVCEALLRELGWTLDAEPDGSECFIPGRGARVLARRGDDRLPVGLMGELHPQVLESFKLVQPAAAFEVDLAPLLAATE